MVMVVVNGLMVVEFVCDGFCGVMWIFEGV